MTSTLSSETPIVLGEVAVIPKEGGVAITDPPYSVDPRSPGLGGIVGHTSTGNGQFLPVLLGGVDGGAPKPESGVKGQVAALSFQLESLEASIQLAVSSRHDEVLFVLRMMDELRGTVQGDHQAISLLNTKFDTLIHEMKGLTGAVAALATVVTQMKGSAPVGGSVSVPLSQPQTHQNAPGRYRLEPPPGGQSNKIPYIKFIRTITGQGLGEAKMFVEQCLGQDTGGYRPLCFVWNGPHPIDPRDILPGYTLLAE